MLRTNFFLILFLLSWIFSSTPLLGSNGSLFGTNLIADIVEKSSDSVVSIDTLTYEKRQYFDPFWDNFIQNVIPRKGQGSGVLIDSEGHIVTNRHVIEHAHEIFVTFEGNQPIKASLVGEDSESDLAILKIPPTKQKFLNLGDSNLLRPGEWIVVLGNPLGLGITVTAGVVSAVNRRLALPGTQRALKNLIQTDAAINPGNSGGPLININGEIVGIATAVVQYYQGNSYQNLGFGIPSNRAKRVITDLIAFGRVRKSFLGISITDFPASDGGTGHGVFVEGVQENTPASEGGLKPKDIITAVNNNSVPDVDRFSENLRNFRVGEKIKVSLIRNKEKMDILIHLKEAPSTDEIPLPQLGMVVSRLTPERISQFGIKQNEGILISNIKKEGPADKIGLELGDIIGKVNDYPLQKPEELHYALSQLDKGENMLFLVIRGNTRKYLVIKKP